MNNLSDRGFIIQVPKKQKRKGNKNLKEHDKLGGCVFIHYTCKDIIPHWRSKDRLRLEF